MIIIVDHGSQYTGLISKNLTLFQAQHKTVSPTEFLNELESLSQYNGVIISGSPKTISVDDDLWAKKVFKALDDLNFPTLGICFGFQLMAKHFGSTLLEQEHREYGEAFIQVTESGKSNHLLKDVPPTKKVWMSHGNSIAASEQLVVLSNSLTLATAFQVKDRNLYSVLYHPEVTHSEYGETVLKNFLDLSKAPVNTKDTNWATFLEDKNDILKDVPKIMCAVSGGVDSTVLAVLLSRYTEVHAIYIDHGLQRSYDLTDLKNVFAQYPNIHLHVLDAKEHFMMHLKGVSDPEAKRIIIGKCFIDSFAPFAKGLGIKYFAQGTIASDVIESGINHAGGAQKIKSHHNVGGLPKDLPFTLIEPLRSLYKDQVRSLGSYLNINESFIKRHPFPGPGLAIRCLGEIHETRIAILRKADEIFHQELRQRELYEKTWQAGVILLPIKSTGVMGDGNSYEECLAIRMVDSIDAMTAEATEVPWKDLKEIGNKIINQVKGVNRIVYDITSKPPATIEWE